MEAFVTEPNKNVGGERGGIGDDSGDGKKDGELGKLIQYPVLVEAEGLPFGTG